MKAHAWRNCGRQEKVTFIGKVNRTGFLVPGNQRFPILGYTEMPDISLK